MVYGTATAIYEEKLVLLNGFKGDSVYSIDIALLFDSQNHTNAWTLLSDSKDMYIPFDGVNVSYSGQSSTQSNFTIYGVPFPNQLDANHLFQFDLKSNKYINAKVDK